MEYKPSDLLTSQQVADYYDISYRHLRRLKEKGRISFHSKRRQTTGYKQIENVYLFSELPSKDSMDAMRWEKVPIERLELIDVLRRRRDCLRATLKLLHNKMEQIRQRHGNLIYRDRTILENKITYLENCQMEVTARIKAEKELK